MKFRTSYLCLAVSLLMLTSAIPLIKFAFAQSSGPLYRSYLSSTGDDSNPCTLPQPCRLVPAALAQTQDGGEIWMLDSANYNTGTVMIDRNVTLQAIPGVEVSLLATDNIPALYIQPGYLTVTLRNIAVRTLGTSGYGVIVNGPASRLLVEDSRFLGGFAIGIEFFSANSSLTVSRSEFVGANTAIFLSGTTSTLTANAVVDHCRFVGPFGGGGEAFETGDSTLMLSHSLISNYNKAISLSSSSVALEDNIIFQNSTGVDVNTDTGGTAQTFGDNTFFNNATNGASLTTLTSE